MEVAETRSHSPASSASRRRARRAKTGFVVSKLGTTRRRTQRQPTQPRRRRYYTEHSHDEDESDPEDTTPPPRHVEDDRQQLQQKKVLPSILEPAVRVITKAIGVEVFVDTLHLRTPRSVFSLILGVIAVSLVFSQTSSLIASVARPVCSIPIASLMVPFCHWGIFEKPKIPSSDGQPVHWADYPGLVALQTKTFDQLLEKSVGNEGLVMEVKRAEMASQDLITLVRASNLKSAVQIADRLSTFVEDARGAGRSLRSLGAKIQGAVDS